MTLHNDPQNNRELSLIVAAVLLLGLLSFIGGYFLGMRHGVRSFMRSQQEEVAQAVLDGATQIFTEEKSTEQLPVTSDRAPQRYWALVTCVDSYALATQIMEHAAHVGIVVRIRKNLKAIPTGKKKVEYQVITPHYNNQEQLDRALQTLKTVPLLAKYMSIETPKLKD